MYSARTRGRSDNSKDASSSIIDPAITRLDILALRQNLERSLEQHIECRILVAVHGPAHGSLGMSAQVSKVFQRRQNVAFDRRFCRTFGKLLQLVLQLENDSLRCLLPDAWNGREARQIGPLNGADEVLNRSARKNRHGKLWADAGNRHEFLEDHSLAAG